MTFLIASHVNIVTDQWLIGIDNFLMILVDPCKNIIYSYTRFTQNCVDSIIDYVLCVRFYKNCSYNVIKNGNRH